MTLQVPPQPAPWQQPAALCLQFPHAESKLFQEEPWQRLKTLFPMPQFPSQGGAGTLGLHKSPSEASANPQIKPHPALGSGQGVKQVELQTCPAVTLCPHRGWLEEDEQSFWEEREQTDKIPMGHPCHGVRSTHPPSMLSK